MKDYANLTAADRALNRIVPIPKQATLLEGDPLKKASCFTVSAPEAPYGPVKTAGERIRKLLSGKEGKAVQVTLTVVPGEHPEGYTLRVTEDAVEITGNDGNGLLYGVITLEQMFDGVEEIPSVEITDWPENPIRGFKEEARYGSSSMNEEEWMTMLEDLAYRKLNVLGITLYGCWGVQYDGRCSEYVYMSVPGLPELKTPKVIKYYSPEEDRWIEREELPPIFCGDLLEKVFAKARDLGMQVTPGWNSFGHNTLIPYIYPEVAPVNEEGVPQTYGFCTSNEKTYELLFSIYDHLIDKYMKPYGMTMMSLGLDEVHAGINKNPDDIWQVQNPWCKCEKCRDQDMGDIFINHAVKLVSYLKRKGIKGVHMACDMLQEGRRSKLGFLGDRLMDACRKADVLDTLIIGWWSYHDIPSKNWIKTLYPEKGMRNIVAPWNGYHTWSITLQPLRNTEMLAQINKRDGGEGISAYASWDRACDRTHDCIAEYAWDTEGAGTTLDVTERYVARHYPGHERLAYRAYRLMDLAMEQRHTKKWSFPDKEAVSYMDLMTYQLSPYNYAYPKVGMPYPRAFADEALSWVLTMRDEVELALFNIRSQSEEACNIFRMLTQAPGVDQEMAWRQLCEAENYLVLAQDWLAILKMHDLCQAGQAEKILPIAESRYQARLELMKLWQQHKERCVAEGMGLRQQNIFLQLFRDLADYVQQNPDQPLSMTDLHHTLSQRALWLR